MYFYNVFGGREISEGEYSTVVAKFLKLRSLGLPLSVVLPGSQKRNFTHIDDIVDGICKAAFEGEGDGYCIGSDQSISVVDLANMISDNIVYLPERAGNRMGASIDNSKLKKLGWKCNHSIVDYIRSEVQGKEVPKK